jgi:site-specific DNA-methyltransferase (adenine-specific)
VTANILRAESLDDGYDKFFLVPKVRQHADDFNHHPTLKPVNLMHHLVKLISFTGQTILDPFMGSGSTGLAAVALKRKFVGFEKETEYYKIAEKRFNQSTNKGLFDNTI